MTIDNTIGFGEPDFLYAGKAEVEVAYEYIVVMVAGCNQSGLLLLACIVGLIV